MAKPEKKLRDIVADASIKFPIRYGIAYLIITGGESLFSDTGFLNELQNPKNIFLTLGVCTGLEILDVITYLRNHTNQEKTEPYSSGSSYGK